MTRSVCFIGLALLSALTYFFIWKEPRTTHQSDDLEAEAKFSVVHDERSMRFAHDAFESAYHRILDTGTKVEEDSFDQILELAIERRRAMRLLMHSDPDQFLDYSLSYSEYEQLPVDLKSVVERPFTQRADFSVIVSCDDSPKESSTDYSLQFESGEVLGVGPDDSGRSPLSKRGLPLQGVELDGKAVLRGSIFQEVEGEEREWVIENLKLARGDAGIDFLSNERFVGEGVVAVSGGYAFSFKDRSSLELLEASLKELDVLPGEKVGSSGFLETIASYEAEPFPIDTFIGESKEASLQNAQGEVKYLIIRVGYEDEPEAPLTVEELRAGIYSISKSFAVYSYGKSILSTDITEETYIVSEKKYYAEEVGYARILHDALEAYKADGNTDPYDEYDVVAVNFPGTSGKNFALGRAIVGGAGQWLNGRVIGVILHELGHNLGVHHANYWKNTGDENQAAYPLDDFGESEEYGDPFDMMGQGKLERGHFSVFAKQLFGWLDDSQWMDIRSAADNGSYRVYAFDDLEATGLLALRIPILRDKGALWLSYRSLYDEVPHLSAGAYILWRRDPSTLKTRLIDPLPGEPPLSREQPNEPFESGLPVGYTFSDPETDLHITTNGFGVDEKGAFIDVTVNIGPFEENRPPQASDVDVSGNQMARHYVVLSVSANDPDGDALSYGWDFGDGHAHPNSPRIECSFLSGGMHEGSVTISDQKGGVVRKEFSLDLYDPLDDVVLRESPRSSDLLSVACNEELVIATGRDNTLLYSKDGANWEVATIENPVAQTVFEDVVWDGDVFLAVGSEESEIGVSGVVYASSSGAIWTKVYQSEFVSEGGGFRRIAANEELDIVLVIGGEKLVCRRDGSGEWTETLIEIDSGLNLGRQGDLVYGDGYFLLTASEYESIVSLLLRSRDGLEWEDLDVETENETGFGRRFESLYFCNELFLAYAKERTSGSHLLRSIDYGSSWLGEPRRFKIDVPDFRFSSPKLNSLKIAYGGGVFFAQGQYSEYRLIDSSTGEFEVEESILEIVSRNGIDWAETKREPEHRINDIVSFQNTFVSVGDGGLIGQTAWVNPAYSDWIAGFEISGSDREVSSNPDFDWATNCLEYALGSDPSKPQSSPRMPEIRVESGNRIVISIHRFQRTMIRMSLEVSRDLREWEPLESSATMDTDSLLELSAVLESRESETLFFRIRVDGHLVPEGILSDVKI